MDATSDQPYFPDATLPDDLMTDEVEVSPLWTASVLHVGGEVDILTASTLRDRILDELAHGSETVIVDLSEVTFVSSSGIGALLASRDAAEPGRLRLVTYDTSIIRRALVSCAGNSPTKAGE
jgi:anti-anti-sigma factor